jgi:hypothetical protein
MVVTDQDERPPRRAGARVRRGRSVLAFHGVRRGGARAPTTRSSAPRSPTELGARPADTLLVRVQRPSDIPLESLHGRQGRPRAHDAAHVVDACCPAPRWASSRSSRSRGTSSRSSCRCRACSRTLEVADRVNTVLVSRTGGRWCDGRRARGARAARSGARRSRAHDARRSTRAAWSSSSSDAGLLDDGQAAAVEQVAAETARHRSRSSPISQHDAGRRPRGPVFARHRHRSRDRWRPALARRPGRPPADPAHRPERLGGRRAAGAGRRPAHARVLRLGGAGTARDAIHAVPRGRRRAARRRRRIATWRRRIRASATRRRSTTGIRRSRSTCGASAGGRGLLERAPHDAEGVHPARDRTALWRSRYGALTSIRVPRRRGSRSTPPGTRSRAAAGDRSARARPRRARCARPTASSASRGATDFGEYFVYFSFFLVVSALLLAALFFKLGVEQRVREVGLLRAVGFGPPACPAAVPGRGPVLAVAGSAAGVARRARLRGAA